MEIDEFWYRYMNANSSAILLDELCHFFRTNFRFFSVINSPSFYIFYMLVITNRDFVLDENLIQEFFNSKSILLLTKLVFIPTKIPVFQYPL